MTLLRTTIECAISEHEQGRKNAVADRLSIASIEAAMLEERLAAATERAEKAELAAANAEEGREHALRHLTEVERERDALKKLVEEAVPWVEYAAAKIIAGQISGPQAWLARAKEAVK